MAWLGDWCGYGAPERGHGLALVTLEERKPRYTVLPVVRHKIADGSCTGAGVVRRLGPYKVGVQAMRYDKGREWDDHSGMAQDLNAQIYFAYPDASWEGAGTKTRTT